MQRTAALIIITAALVAPKAHTANAPYGSPEPRAAAVWAFDVQEPQPEPFEALWASHGATATVEPVATPTPAPAPTPPPAIAPLPGPAVTAASVEALDVRAVLERAGWPADVIPAAMRVVACESGGRADSASTRYQDASGMWHQDLGLFQLHQTWYPDGTPGWGWHSVYGAPLDLWADAEANARLALRVYQYDIDRGHAPWYQWTCKP